MAGKYRLERVLGRGGMGVVYLAKHVELEEHVAVKVMLPEAAKNPEAVTRFVREARAAAKIRSEHVVRVSDVGMLDDGQPYMAMEYLEGSDLRQILTARQRLPLDETAEYLLQALEALSEAHVLGIVHRDLKPGNLFVTRRRDGTPIVKVLDFGISKIVSGALAPSDPLTNVSVLMGSPLYMSPEQMKASRNVDMRSDLWSLGVILYELLSGDVPFKGDSLPELCAMIVLDGEPPRARDHVPELPAAIDDVIARCLERRLDARFANAAELARALAPFAPDRARVSVARIAASLLPPADVTMPMSIGVGLGVGAGAAESATNATWSESAHERRGRRGTWLAAAGGAALVLAGIAAVSLRRAPPTAVASAPAVAARVASVEPQPEAPAAPSVTAAASTATAAPTSVEVIASASAQRAGAPPPTAGVRPKKSAQKLDSFGGRR